MNTVFSNTLHISSLRLSLISALLSTALLSACGGGGSSSSSSSSGSSAAAASEPVSASTSQDSAVVTKPNAVAVSTKQAGIGAVTGFGSVIVEGVKYEDTSASVQLEIDPTQPVTGALTDIKLGVRLAVQADGQQARSFTLGAEVMGRVESLGPDSVRVAGQTVKASFAAGSPTVFEGVTNLSGLAQGDFVEVHGLRDASDTIIASRVERKNIGSANITRVSGTLSSLNKAAKTFAISGLTVSWANAVRVVPSFDALVEGAHVAVFSESAPQALVLSAKAIKLAAPGAGLSGSVRVGGEVAALDAASSSFTVAGIKVDGSKARVVNGVLADLANGLRVRVAGSYANGVVTASEISIQKPSSEPLVDVKGAVTDFMTAASFKVRGVTFDASSPAITFINGDASKLAAGVWVRIKGGVKGDVVRPVSVEFLAAPVATTPAIPASGDLTRAAGVKDASFDVQGSVSDLDVAAKTVRINGSSVLLPVEVAGTEVLEALKNGTQIQVQGSAQNGMIVATKLVIK